MQKGAPCSNRMGFFYSYMCALLGFLFSKYLPSGHRYKVALLGRKSMMQKAQHLLRATSPAHALLPKLKVLRTVWAFWPKAVLLRFRGKGWLGVFGHEFVSSSWRKRGSGF